MDFKVPLIFLQALMQVTKFDVYPKIIALTEITNVVINSIRNNYIKLHVKVIKTAINSKVKFSIKMVNMN